VKVPQILKVIDPSITLDSTQTSDVGVLNQENKWASRTLPVDCTCATQGRVLSFSVPVN
jgi:hypothetical protein